MSGPRVVVVGAGFAGAATALHLARAGARVVILEREAMAGIHATSQNAGMLRTAIADPALARVAVAGARGVEAARAWTDVTLVRPSGSLLLAGGSARKELESVTPDLSALRSTVRWLEPKDAVSRVPALRGGTFEAALWSPEDGVVDSAEYFAALVRGARALGAQLRLATEVLGGDPGDDSQPARLATTTGPVEADAVVIAGGAWSDVVAERLQVRRLGIVPYRRHLHATGPLPTVDPSWPFVWAVDDEVYFRPESGGLLLSPCDQEAFQPCEPPADPANRELLARKVAAAFPGLLDLPIMRSWAGLRSFVPDHRFVLGRDPLAQRVFWAAGLGGHGVTSAWEVGRIVADAVLGLAPPPPEFAPGR
ncbi:MAG: FAD-binding oxidoreductase [Deltaproteobacteria bacterium]|nr:FAD-binding oxidoreductase [Deltaproteobacteria bacterium]